MAQPLSKGGGKNCCVPQCTNNWRKTGNSVSYLSIPKEEDSEWRGKMLAAISRGDRNFKPNSHKICSSHFEPKCLIFHGKGSKLATGSLPTLNMPQKSVQSTPPAPRREPTYREPPPVPDIVAYYSFEELQDEVKDLYDPWTLLRKKEMFLAIGSIDENLEVATKVIFSDGSFMPLIHRYNRQLKKVYNVEVMGLLRVLKQLDSMQWCSRFTARDCHVAVETEGPCSACLRIMQKKVTICTKTPLSSVPKEILIREVKSNRSQLKEKEAQLADIQCKIGRESQIVAPSLQADLEEIMKSKEIENPFMKLFWEEQQKAMVRDPKGRRWHPMMIRFAIYLHYHSPRAYEALRETGVICLPSKSTLFDYTSVLDASEGFHTHVFKSIEKSLETLPENERFGVIMFDEMSVRSDLVYSCKTDELIGFVGPSTWSFSEKGIKNEQVIATHVLAFMVIGVNNPIKECLGYFATTAAKYDVLFRWMWRAVAYLEMHGMKIIACTSDKASSNQRLYRTVGDCVNPYANDHRHLFMISDPPHLIKTLRNNLESRPLWKNGHEMNWSQIWDVFRGEGELRRTKLTDKHMYLTPGSRMSVKLAVQVLSKRVGSCLKSLGPKYSETATFVLLCNRFFDCLNGQSETPLDQQTSTQNRDLLPYRDVNDPRFEFLKDFLQYFILWKDEVDKRQGFSKKEKERMFITAATFEGIKSTVRSFIGAAEYLLQNGVTVLKSNIFCQDPLENRFGRHRGIGARSRNPSVKEFGHQEVQLHLQRSMAMQFTPRGNVTGEKGVIKVSDEPLPKRKK